MQRWAEESGNAALEGRELPPAEVIAADQRIGWWARQLKKAGWREARMSCAPGPIWISCSAPTPAPARTQRGRTADGPDGTGDRRLGRRRVTAAGSAGAI